MFLKNVKRFLNCSGIFFKNSVGNPVENWKPRDLNVPNTANRLFGARLTKICKKVVGYVLLSEKGRASMSFEVGRLCYSSNRSFQQSAPFSVGSEAAIPPVFCNGRCILVYLLDR